MADQSIALVEPVAIADTFVSGVGCVDELAPNLFRVVYYTTQKTNYGNDRENMVVAKFIVTLETLLAMSAATTTRHDPASETAGLPASSLN